jgi:hypothetical protein
MIKIQNGVASREHFPAFLQGLAPESLADLSWTDSALGVQNCAWFKEESNIHALGANEKYGSEIFTIDSVRKVVVVSRQILQMSQDEIDEEAAKVTEQKQQRIDAITSQIEALQQQLEKVNAE